MGDFYRKVELFSYSRDENGNEVKTHFGWHFQPKNRGDVDRPITDALDIAAVLARPCQSNGPSVNPGTSGGSLVRGTPRRPIPGGSPGAAKRLPAVLRP